MPTSTPSIAGVGTCSCGAVVDRAHTLSVRNNNERVEHVCFQCLTQHYATCTCGNLTHYRDAFIHEGTAYCAACASNNFLTSMHDNNRYHRSQMRSDSRGDWLLGRCLEGDSPEYVICNNSGIFVLVSEAVFREGKYYHPDHVPVRHKVNRYSHRPTPIFHGSEQDHLKMGIELEIEGGGYSDRRCDELLRLIHPEGEVDAETVMYGKSDSSIDNGFEIVTHPCTFAYHMNDIAWSDLLDRAKTMGYHNIPRTCGLHVHLSRRFWGQTEARQDAGIMKMLFLIERFWDNLLVFSRRTQEQVDRWASRYGMKDTPRALLDYAKSGQGRYKAVNLENANTIELRVFRGTLDPVVFKATIQFCFVLAQVSKNTSVENIVNVTWNDLCVRFRDHEELWEYLGKLRLQKELTEAEKEQARKLEFITSIIDRVLPVSESSPADDALLELLRAVPEYADDPFN